jgi:eukaryotic-like serine/threonine-protein kinase
VLGKSVGPYLVLEKLGAGGMGEVFLGHDPRLERRVALKCLSSGASASADSHARVLREARAIARLTHPHIAGIYDVLEQDGRAFIVMEYVEGISLAAHLASGPLPPAEVRLIGRQLASALAAAHAQGVIHRDLKPANIQVMRDGSIKVLDFGVAKVSASPSTIVDTTIDNHSLGGNPGTPLYMAPEQLAGRPADIRSDLYSAGVILFQIATGRRPYLETTAVTLALAMNADPAPAARTINPLVPLELSDAIAKALKRTPDHRYQFARELDAALSAMSGTSSSTRMVGAPDSGSTKTVGFARRHRWTLAATVAVLLLIGLAVRWPLMIGSRLSHAVPVGVTPARRAVAVLPLDNLSGDVSKGYLGTGVADTLTMALSKMPGLTVLSRSEVQEVIHGEHDVRKVARTLDVAFVVDGSVQQAGDRLRITLRVIRPDGTVAWSEAYEDETAAVFAMHRTMAADLVTQMEGRASDIDLTVPTTTNVEALTAYWQGRATSDRAVSDADFTSAATSFRQAIARDPKFALGYAGLADTLWLQYQVTHDAVLPRQALDAGLTALSLDPRQPATRVAVATVYQGLGQNEEAADQLRRALDLQPSNDDAHRILARVLAAQGKPEQAIAELQQALALRPRRWVNYNALGRLYYDLRRLPEAAATFQRALEISPDDARTYLSLGGVQLEMGDFDHAIEMFDRSNKIAPTGLALTNLGTAYYRLGRFADAASAYEAALKLDAKAPLLHGNLGDAYLRLDRKADAVREFTSARELALGALRVNNKDARSMSRAAVFEAKLGLKAEAAAHAAQAVALAPRDPGVQYKQAVVAALIGDRTTAFRALEQALTLGFKANDARNDYDLAAIKNSPEFTALLNNHR